MKKLFLILFLFTITSYSQILDNWDIDFNLGLDMKLSTQTDDWGNEPFTLNYLFKGKLINKDDRTAYKPIPYYVTLGYEYADLSKSYHRASIGGGIFFATDYLNTNWKRIDIGIQIDVNSGMIIRETQTFFPSFGIDAEMYFMREKVGFAILGQLVQRSDIDDTILSIFFELKHRL